MERLEALAICRNRLEVWANTLGGEVATPVLLLGVKQGENAGSLVLCFPGNLPAYAVRELLSAALRALPANGRHP